MSYAHYRSSTPAAQCVRILHPVDPPRHSCQPARRGGVGDERRRTPGRDLRIRRSFADSRSAQGRSSRDSQTDSQSPSEQAVPGRPARTAPSRRERQQARAALTRKRSLRVQALSGPCTAASGYLAVTIARRRQLTTASVETQPAQRGTNGVGPVEISGYEVGRDGGKQIPHPRLPTTRRAPEPSSPQAPPQKQTRLRDVQARPD